MSLSALSPASRRIVGGVSRFGIAARGAVFGLVGWFLIAAAYHANPGQARGLGGARRGLGQQRYGFALLAAAAMGMIAFGVFEFIRARYRYIDPS